MLDATVSVRLSYYYVIDILDVDNIIKPVLDELKGLVYHDDIQVIKVISQKQSVLAESVAPVATPELSNGLRSQSDFLYVLVEWEA